MRGLDVAVVRFMPFIMYLFIGYVIISAWCGRYVIEAEFLFGNSLLYSTGFLVVSLSNKKYHCKWNRCMYAMLVLTPLINYLDAMFDLFKEAEQQLLFMSFIWIITAFSTMCLAMNSFFFKRKI